MSDHLTVVAETREGFGANCLDCINSDGTFLNLGNWTEHEEALRAERMHRDYEAGRWCGECRYESIEDPACCAWPVAVSAGSALGGVE